jgi:hypothetical protein
VESQETNSLLLPSFGNYPLPLVQLKRVCSACLEDHFFAFLACD